MFGHNETTNQIQLKYPRLLSQQLRKRYYKTFEIV